VLISGSGGGQRCQAEQIACRFYRMAMPGGAPIGGPATSFPRPGQARNTGHGPIIVPRSALITMLSDDLAHSGHNLTRAVRHGEYESYSVELA
jgi:hypothetical protein